MQTLLRRIHPELSLRSLSVRAGMALGTITALGLLLRASARWGRFFAGDEVATLTDIKKSASYILTHFEGQLTMNYFLLAEKAVAWLCGTIDWRLTLLPLAAAVAVIPLTASVALKFTGSVRTALIAAGLTAFNPFLIFYGPVIRAYSPLAACSLLATNEFLHWYQQRDWWSGGRCAAVILLLLLVNLNGVYTVAFLLLLFAIEIIFAGWFPGRKLLWKSRTLWIPVGVAASLTFLAYYRLLPAIAKYSQEWTDTPPTSMEYLPLVFSEYFAGSYAALFFAVLLLLGVWSATQQQKQILLLCAATALGPVLMSLRGVSVYPWAYARFLVFSLPLLLILLAEGINWLAMHVSVRKPATAAVIAWSLTALAAVCWMPQVFTLLVRPNVYRTYTEVAQFLRTQFHNGDTIVTRYDSHFRPAMAAILGTSEGVMGSVEYFRTLATRLDAPVTGRVFYIAPVVACSGARKTSVKRLGELEIYVYALKTVRGLLQEWRDDLLYRTADCIDENLQYDYELLALIDERSPSGQSPDHWRLLAERCFEQTPTMRYMPPQLLNKRRSHN